VRPCTPFVIEPIGTSSTERSGHNRRNSSRLVAPWSRETPFDRAASRRPIIAMLKVSSAAAPPL
jgi:hypothetical protein